MSRRRIAINSLVTIIAIVAWIIGHKLCVSAERDLSLAVRDKSLARARELAVDQRLSRDSALVAALTMAFRARPADQPTPPKGEHKAARLSDTMASEPMLQLLYLEWQRATIALEYDRFFDAAHLTEAERNAFEGNLLSWREKVMDLKGISALRSELTKDEIRQQRDKFKSEYEAAQLQLLGKARYEELGKFHKEMLLGNIVTGVSGMAALNGLPLTSEQQTKLIAALSQSADATAIDPLQTLQSVDWSAADILAKQVLTPEQFELFRSMSPNGPYVNRWGIIANSKYQRTRKENGR